MTRGVHVSTERLILRDWRDDDVEPFAAMNADDAVMAFFPQKLSRSQSDDLVHRIRSGIAIDGFGLYAAERIDTGKFIGFIGLGRPTFEAAFTPAVEIGWRLAREAWRFGYATEGARGVLAHAFGSLGLTSVVSFTAAVNQRSRRVMERIGMTRDPSEDFVHPNLPAAHPLAAHVLYGIDEPRFRLTQEKGVADATPSRR